MVSKEKPIKQNKKPKIKVFTKTKNKKDPDDVLAKKLQEKYDTIDSNTLTKFSDFPLSPKTLKGLRECGYHKPTDIQKESIGLALKGKDILGAAQTGSGKTLAFLLPILERLFCQQWTRVDGLGALVITPTRELAYQIFEELRRVGEHHDFSAGLIIGGKDLKFERGRMDQCNIIICTPGRLLQHMDENPLFDCANMQILVLDEADRCLDMGFEQTMNAIIANLPAQRQTLLFSATQTKSVKDLARLSLKDPSYVAVHEHSEFSTPKELQQSYVVCELEQKVSILWSFIKNHLKQKVIVFLSSCKQVKYMYEVFCKLRPGTSLLALYGTLHQLRRMDIYETFCKKQSAVLFATDLAARGLDFPEVHWVVQADCPEDVATYIHRVGRTARYQRGGESMLLLLESELPMVEKLEEKKIPINRIEINPMKLNNPVRKMEAFLARDPALKDTAQRAFVSYAKAVFLMKDKEVFDVQKLNTEAYAHSLGLAIPPRIRFLQRMNAKAVKSVAEVQLNKKIRFSDAESEDEEDKEELRPPADFSIENSDEENEDDIFTVKRRDHDIELPTEQEMALLTINQSRKSKKPITKAALVRKLGKKNIVSNKKVIFDEDGEAVADVKDRKSTLAQEYQSEDVSGIDIERAKLVLKEEDKFDKQLFKEKVKAKHKEEKRKLKEQKKRQRQEEKEEEEGEKDDFGTDDDEEEPDLSWLPDPDKIYGEKTEEELERDEMELKKGKAVKRKQETVKTKKKKRKIEELDVNEAEQLALMLLKN